MERLSEALRNRIKVTVKRTREAIADSLVDLEQKSKVNLVDVKEQVKTQLFETKNQVKTQIYEVKQQVETHLVTWNNFRQTESIQSERFAIFLLKLLLKEQKSPAEKPRFKAGSLFPDGSTTLAALTLVLRGVAEVLSQKSDLSWKIKSDSILSYEKPVNKGRSGQIEYYISDESFSPQKQASTIDAALTTIEEFDPRAGAIHLIYCAKAAELHQPCNQAFAIDDKQLVEYTGLSKRRDLSKSQKLEILDTLVRQPAQVLAEITWFNTDKIPAFTTTDWQIWNVSVEHKFAEAENSHCKPIGLTVTVKPGEWARYFLNKSEYYYHTGIITKKTVQTLFSIGKHNVGAARILIWLTFQIGPGLQNRLIGKTLLEIAYGEKRVTAAASDRQLRRCLADDFETDMNVVKKAGWQIELEIGPDWLENKQGKRPAGFWQELLISRWRFNLPLEAQQRLNNPQSQNRITRQTKNLRQLRSPSGEIIRKARKAKGWSRAFFASTMGKSISWVDAVETNHRQVSAKDLPMLIERLDLHPMDW
ncbi:hypothetical protein FACHB389_30450 [Nostoc calcicola FACHB-389]|nr:helix-turn-helix transcriptional regulator [Nostoc calcicola FACHB-3891]OKH23587.1 hypothetical protein FACHB389_30450 [Nostoc calcicola FACHB-389]